MIKAIIFDLDMCILDTLSLTGPFFDPVLEVLQKSEISDDVKRKIQAQLWTTSLDDASAMFAIPSDVVDRMRDAYRIIEVPDGIKTYGDEECIAMLPVKKILVTSGYQKFQDTKIEKLGITHLFDEIIIDAVDYPAKRKGKKKIFEELLIKNGWEAKEVFVVGDNPVSELGAAKALGIPTIQTLRPSIIKWDGADHHITSLKAIEALI